MDVFWLWIHTSPSSQPPKGSSWPWVFAWPKTKPLHFSVNCVITVTLQTSKPISNCKWCFETVRMFQLGNGRLENLAISTLSNFFKFLAKIIFKSWPRKFHFPWIYAIPWVCSEQILSLLRWSVFGEHLPISHSLQPSCQVPAFKYLLCSQNLIKPCSPLSPSLPPDSPLPGMCSDVTASLTKKITEGLFFFYFFYCCDCCFLSASPKQTLPLKFGLLHYPAAATGSPPALLPGPSARRDGFCEPLCPLRLSPTYRHCQHRAGDHFKTHLWFLQCSKCVKKRVAPLLLPPVYLLFARTISFYIALNIPSFLPPSPFESLQQFHHAPALGQKQRLAALPGRLSFWQTGPQR